MKAALIVCGALAREVLALKEKHGWQVDIFAAPALLHNEPERIPAAILERIREAKKTSGRVFVVYGDCGTGGMLNKLLDEEGVACLGGPHCYEMYAGERFEKIMAEAPGTFFLTDYLVGSFDHLVMESLGLDRHPDLRDEYFKNYTRVVYLAQRDEPALLAKAERAAEQLGLPLEIIKTGYGKLETRLKELLEG